MLVVLTVSTPYHSLAAEVPLLWSSSVSFSSLDEKKSDLEPSFTPFDTADRVRHGSEASSRSVGSSVTTPDERAGSGEKNDGLHAESFTLSHL